MNIVAFAEKYRTNMELLHLFFFFVIRARSLCHGYTAALRLIVQPYPPLFFRSSHFRRQVPPRP